ncbi:unnamed protein product [Lasius platythorax]|uniref:CCHC-type domain-containing protein n=1 Tax=Lasius platythorax TaxID=488582 RepID=A0AAV2MWR4_9HYME
MQSIKQRPRESDKSKGTYNKRPETITESSSTTGSGFKPAKSATSTITCYNCNEQGHYSFKCTKKITKCTVCNKLGHLATNCPRLPSNNKSSDTKEKTVMLVNLDEVNDKKYIMNLKINDQFITGYIDLGSQCTLLRHNKAVWE